jgi:hypothetical protein
VTGKRTKLRRGETLAISFCEFLEDNKREEIEEFVASYKRGSPNDKRRFIRLILKFTSSIADTKIITDQNDDVVNFCKHISIVGKSLPMRD